MTLTDALMVAAWVHITVVVVLEVQAFADWRDDRRAERLTR